MAKYTAYGKKVDEYIKKDYLDKIIKSFTNDCNPISIILFGGFGKGEGSVQIVKGKPVPFNDFDLYVVTGKKLTDEELDKISMNASKEIGMGGLEVAYFPDEGYDSNKFFHVDARCIPYDKLSNLMKTQRYYELKYGSQVIYGDETILDRINEIKPEEIPNSEGLRNLFNKLHTMLLGLREDYNDEQKKIRIFWSNKSYMSICEALLILDKKFAPTSLERSKIFAEIYKNNFPDLYEKIPDLAEKARKATDFKLKPNFKIKEHEKIWNETLKDILFVFEYYIKKITGTENVADAINNRLPYNYFAPYLEHKIGFNFFPAQYALNIGYFNILKKQNETHFAPLFTWKDAGLRMVLPIYYLLKNKSENDEIYLDKAYEELKKLIKVKRKEFWHLKERALKAYGLYYEQRLL
ncbi:hypothetical protein HY449_02885 [Candidatus Pacearchaeota archaeon]|nr:hypothetical protein [Candidatus Pacearchaeota archaeon]